VLPYWRECPDARWRLAGVVALTLATTGVSVVFNFLGRDFFNALSERDVDAFQTQLVRYLGGFAVGVPVFVVKRYFQVGFGTRVAWGCVVVVVLCGGVFCGGGGGVCGLRLLEITHLCFQK
jgi:hypothetical protein